MLYQLSYASPTTTKHCRETPGNPRTHSGSAHNTAQFLRLAHRKLPGKPPYPQTIPSTYGCKQKREIVLHRRKKTTPFDAFNRLCPLSQPGMPVLGNSCWLEWAVAPPVGLLSEILCARVAEVSLSFAHYGEIMRRISSALAFVLSSSLVYSQQPQSSAPTNPKPVAQSVPGALPSPHTLLDGTPVKLRLSQSISSADTKVGQEVPFEVVEEIKVDDIVVLPKGATAIANVTEAEHRREWGGQEN
jgi:hypothetical protein